MNQLTLMLEHFKRMQTKAAQYLTPAPYIDREGNTSKVAVGLDKPVRDNLFAADMLHMLDGPEQRDAQAALESAMLELDQACEWRMDIRKQVTMAEEASKVLHAKNKELIDEVNDLRARLHASELAYARLHGYVERIEDERPPAMQPVERERSLASMPDGTMGTQYGGWQGGSQVFGRQERPKRWTDRA